MYVCACMCVCVSGYDWSGGFSIWRSAHFNLVVRRKRFELVFHADTDIHRTQYSLHWVLLDARYPSQAGSLSVAFPLISKLASPPPAKNFCARFLIFWRVFHLFGVYFFRTFFCAPLAQLARSWTWTFSSYVAYLKAKPQSKARKAKKRKKHTTITTTYW